MTDKNLERAFWIVIIVVYAVIGYWCYQVLVKPAAKATLQFFNASSATQQIGPTKSKSNNSR